MSLQNSHQISDVKVLLAKGIDGAGIESIEKTSTVGFVDTYTITLTDGSKYTFTVTNGNWGVWTSPVSCASGTTQVTIVNANISSSSIIEVYFQNTSGQISISSISVSTGTAVITVDELTETTQFVLHIVNSVDGGAVDTYTRDEIDALLSLKQDVLTEGQNITIDNQNEISSSTSGIQSDENVTLT